ncbi:MAG: hypothetical protein ACOCVG_02170 [Verrucomicrobiota bacterium]
MKTARKTFLGILLGSLAALGLGSLVKPRRQSPTSASTHAERRSRAVPGPRGTVAREDQHFI